MKHPVILDEDEAWLVLKALRRAEGIRGALVEAGFTDLLHSGLDSNGFQHAITVMEDAGAVDRQTRTEP